MIEIKMDKTDKQFPVTVYVNDTKKRFTEKAAIELCKKLNKIVGLLPDDEIVTWYEK